MPITYLTGWIVDNRGRTRFVPEDAFVTSCNDPRVVVINQRGHFYIPNLEAGKSYDLVARNGDQVKRWSFKPKAGHNELTVRLPTKAAKIPATTGKLLANRQAGA